MKCRKQSREVPQYNPAFHINDGKGLGMGPKMRVGKIYTFFIASAFNMLPVIFVYVPGYAYCKTYQSGVPKWLMETHVDLKMPG
jgi:hypothetical protein